LFLVVLEKRLPEGGELLCWFLKTGWPIKKVEMRLGQTGFFVGILRFPKAK